MARCLRCARYAHRRQERSVTTCYQRRRPVSAGGGICGACAPECCPDSHAGGDALRSALARGGAGGGTHGQSGHGLSPPASPTDGGGDGAARPPAGPPLRASRAGAPLAGCVLPRASDAVRPSDPGHLVRAMWVDSERQSDQPRPVYPWVESPDASHGEGAHPTQTSRRSRAGRALILPPRSPKLQL